MRVYTRYFHMFFIKIALLAFSVAFIPQNSILGQDLNPDPPGEAVKLVFIHHSCGENWLSDDDGELGFILGENNYFVSDTNYGWGPDSIGDATDYYNWYDWFLGPDSLRYLDALYKESGQSSSYTRPISDPGGENQLIMFKSCFPNSDLAGSPDDPPIDGEWNTIGHAKYVYNQLLTYFTTRPDKLFIAITPPPLLDSSHTENAREFSRWLVEDWLIENDYQLNNIAVWDFHNVLTHPDNHHRIQNGSTEYTIYNGDGILFYDSDGDEHPNRRGNQKSTAEFLPMLNVFYHNWIAGRPPLSPIHTSDQPLPDTPIDPTENDPISVPADIDSTLIGVVDDFETGPPPGTNGWEAFQDSTTNSTLTCKVDHDLASSGLSSLQIDFHVEPEGWATCPLLYDLVAGFGDTQGVSFDYRSTSQGLIFDIHAYGGSPEARSTFFHTLGTSPESIDGWVHIDLIWDQIVRVDWEENAGAPVNPEEINGFAFGFSALSNKPNSGTIWIDNLRLITVGTKDPSEASRTPDLPASEQAAESSEGGRGGCLGSTGLIALAMFIQGYWKKRQFGGEDVK